VVPKAVFGDGSTVATRPGTPTPKITRLAKASSDSDSNASRVVRRSGKASIIPVEKMAP